MAAAGHAPPPREVALRREAWLDDASSAGVGSFFGRMMSGGVGGIIDAWRADLSLEGALAEDNRARAAEAAAAAEVTDAEAGWLAERIGRDGVVTPNEKALLAFIGEDGPRLHPKLAALAARAA
jgi:hypothetical protein